MWAMEGEWSNAPSKTHHRRQAIRVVQRTHLGYCHRDLGKRHVVLALLARVVQLLLKQLEVAHALGVIERLAAGAHGQRLVAGRLAAVAAALRHAAPC